MNGSGGQAPDRATAETCDGPLGGSAAAIHALAATGPAPDRADGLVAFGQLVGSWTVDITYFDQVGNLAERRRAEWHFGWILEGRAIQDVLFGPPAAERRLTGEPAREYGSTLRMYDPSADIWHCTWFAPVRGVVVHLAGGLVGEDIVLEGTELDGTSCRWVFSEITPETFLWNGFEGKDRTAERPLVQRMHAWRAR